MKKTIYFLLPVPLLVYVPAVWFLRSVPWLMYRPILSVFWGSTAIAVILSVIWVRVLFSADDTSKENENSAGDAGGRNIIEDAAILEMRGFVHDFRNHLQVLDGLLQEQDFASAGDYLKELKSADQTLIIERAAVNPYLDQILRHLKSACGDRGVSLELDVRDMNLAFLQPKEVVSLFGNLCDNALEAAVQCSQPYIRVRIRERSGEFGELFVSIVNSCDKPPAQDQNGNPLSSKRPAGVSGLGWGNIRRILRRHHAVWRAGYIEARREFSVTIQIQY